MYALLPLSKFEIILNQIKPDSIFFSARITLWLRLSQRLTTLIQRLHL